MFLLVSEIILLPFNNKEQRISLGYCRYFGIQHVTKLGLLLKLYARDSIVASICSHRLLSNYLDMLTYLYFPRNSYQCLNQIPIDPMGNKGIICISILVSCFWGNLKIMH